MLQQVEKVYGLFLLVLLCCAFFVIGVAIIGGLVLIVLCCLWYVLRFIIYLLFSISCEMWRLIKPYSSPNVKADKAI